MPLPVVTVFALCTFVLVRFDVREHRLPNRWNAVLAVTGLLWHARTAMQSAELTPLLSAGFVATASLLGMLVLHAASRGGLGLGDVKLVGALGCLFANGWAMFAIVALAFTVSAAWATLQLLRRRYHRGSRLAFGPFILLGAWIVLTVP